MKYCIDKKELAGDRLLIEGWAVPEVTRHGLLIQLETTAQAPADGDVTIVTRADVAESVAGSRDYTEYGFKISAPTDKVSVLRVRIQDCEDASDEQIVDVSARELARAQRFAKPKKAMAMAKGFIKSDDKKGYLKNVVGGTGKVQDMRYRKWYKESQPSLHTLKKQADIVFPYMPMISLVVPVYHPKPAHLKALVKSVMNQSYQNWQLCLANGSGEDAVTSRLIQRLCNGDSRIVSSRLKVNRGISGNTNVGIQMAEGEWIAFADQDDWIAPDAFFEYVNAMNQDPTLDALYCDEDKIDDATGKHFMPHFKSDFNLDLLLCNNYICHMFMVRQSIVDEIGTLRKEYDGAQDHDFILRCSRACRKIGHVSKILYSWRSHAASTASNADSKTYAFDAGAAAINDYYAVRGIPGKASTTTPPGWYRTEYTLDREPLISILIPNKDHTDDLTRCIHSILEKSTYQNYEILIIENNSEDEETFIAYKRLEREDARIRTITWKEGFNYSAINNFAAAQAKGEYLLLLNNDTELISPDLLTSMAGYLSRPEVGIVGAKLLYPDNTVQHAGVLIGVDHAAHHVFLHYGKDDPGYMGRAMVSQNLSGVTAACLLVKKSVYDQVGGLDEDFVVAYNDVDFCLKVEAAGYLCVYDAFVSMTHYESKSRGYEQTEEQKARFEREKQRLLDKWGARMDADPYYNKNCGLSHGYYQLP